MKITPVASEFIGILASVVKMYRGYIVYIGGCVTESRIFKHPVSNSTQYDLELGNILLE